MGDTTAAARRDDDLTSVVPARRRFTVDEYYRMARAGILHEDDRVELLEGEIVQMAPIGSRHQAWVDYLAEWFITRLVGRAIVRIQGPIRLSSGSEPEPDIALVSPRPDRYTRSHPGPADVFLIVEVADTSLAYDRDVKLPRYAAAGIAEVWIVDLEAENERVLGYRSPHAGRYQHAATVERGSTLSPQAFPDLILPVGELVG